MRIVLVHGAATTSRVWRSVIPALQERSAQRGEQHEVLAVTRPQTGRLSEELDALRSVSAGAFLVGVSGGATLGWALLSEQLRDELCEPQPETQPETQREARPEASRRQAPVGALLHEPAAGSLAPGLLEHVRQGLQAHGVQGFGEALYGRGWSASETEISEDALRREFAMFGAFEPAPLPEHVRPAVLLTVGSTSPPTRHASVRALAKLSMGVRSAVLPCAHAAHLQAPEALAELVLDHVALAGDLSRRSGALCRPVRP
ncbi:alpha/beta fold hydrolase [Kineococcus sp. SYSU DK006]|uniref:alpha/beta fold hydrolase n=1 Tax=Kineococcus sp. SYSU DK006 TaxID=3383127 RepID=UPI003D7E0A30